MRKEYQLNQEQYDMIIEASKPVRYMVVGGFEPRSPQENANEAWRKLGEEVGFIWHTVRPSIKGERFFTAEEKQGG